MIKIYKLKKENNNYGHYSYYAYTGFYCCSWLDHHPCNSEHIQKQGREGANQRDHQRTNERNRGNTKRPAIYQAKD